MTRDPATIWLALGVFIMAAIGAKCGYDIGYARGAQKAKVDCISSFDSQLRELEMELKRLGIISK